MPPVRPVPLNPLHPPVPKPPYPPPPAPLTIRLIDDRGPPFPLPLPPGPPSVIIEPRHRLRPGPPPPPPPPDSVISRIRRRYKDDQFYRSWDNFTLQKQKNRDIRGRNRKSSLGADEIERPVPSLDTNVEGLPGHIVGMNEDGVESSQTAAASYEEAAASCRAKVEAIVRECKRLNQKYHDRQFNLPEWDTLVHLGADDQPPSVKELLGVGAVKRIEDIFDEPEFFEDDIIEHEIRQGNVGNCWFLAAITALSGKPELVRRLCVARDEVVGVYGFVFFRDGEWISEVVDDRLCLRYADDLQQFPTDYLVFTKGDKNAMAQPLSDMSYAVQRLAKDFSQTLRKGSSALFFGSCRESNETWLPLIEKAYAKAHGDYQAIDGGVTGEGIEDLTGGVASYIRSENVLEKDKLWAELMQVNDKFLFGCGTRKGRDSDSADDEGFVRGHAYTVLAAREIDAPQESTKKPKTKKQKEEFEKRKKHVTKDGKVRLVKLHNPWGNQEWNGAWSDGSKELTPEVLKELDHTMGDDGTFFISYNDFLTFYPVIDRIRLIGPEWTVTQQWTSVNVPWTTTYLDTSFRFTITKPGPVVLVLAQPDTRYFRGLTGRYKYSLHFRLYKEGEDTYILRSMDQSGNMRSINAEVDLEAGIYEVLLKVTAERFEDKRTPEQIVREYRDDRREKLLAVGKSYDLAHSKGKLRELEQANIMNNKREGREKRRKYLVQQRERRRQIRARDKARRKRVQADINRKREEKKKRRDEMIKQKRAEAKQKHDEEQVRAELERNKAKDKRRKERTERKNAAPLVKNKSDASKEKNEQSQLETADAVVTENDNDGASETVSENSSTDTVSDLSEHSPQHSGNENMVRSASPLADTPPTRRNDIPPTTNEAKCSQKPEGEPPGDAPEVVSSTTDEKADSEEKRVVFEPNKEPQPQPQPQTTENYTVLKAEAEPVEDSDKDHPYLTHKHDSNMRMRGDHPRPDHFPPPPPPPPPRYTGGYSPGGCPPGRMPQPPRHHPGEMIYRDRPNRMPNTMPMGRPMPPPRRMSYDSMGSDGVPHSPFSSVCDDDFSWDSDIDGPVSLLGSDDSLSDSSDDMYSSDPWQATCVISLRVCSLDENVKVEVVRGSKKREGRSEIAIGRARSPA